jgi:uncharacterized protein (DUF488 family)
MSASRLIFTVGHSSQAIEDFIQQLKLHEIQVLADVRSIPYSSRYPHFSRESLQKSLIVDAIRYLFLGRELGARRDESECYVDGRASYAAITKLPNFIRGIDRLLDGTEKRRIALMCAEQDPLTCHRTILICRELARHGVTIRHICRGGELETHEHAERRLIAEEFGGDEQADLFAGAPSTDTRLNEAYDVRANRIAYRRDASKS